MSFLSALTAKPWLPEPPPALASGPATPAARVALRVLLAVIATLFGLFLLAFLIRAQLPDWQALAGAPGRPLANLAPLWINTALLLASSLALQAASAAARRDDAARLRRALALGALFTLAFLFGQGWVWWRFIEMGHFVASNPAASFFYLLTGVHGLHLAGGLVAWGRVFARAAHGVAPQRLRLAVDLCARYWHFLFAVWLVLFALLASPPQTLRVLAEICGIR
jgi:cytochrome c oxidase subunit 3